MKGTVQQIAWIPEQFATQGRYVRIRDNDGWRVQAVYGRLEKEYVEWKSRDHLTAFGSIM